MGDLAVLAEDPDPIDAALLRDVADNRIHIGWLVPQHREPQASGDDSGKFGDVAGHRVEQFFALMRGDQQNEHHHGPGKGDGEIKTDLELESLPIHRVFRLPLLRPRRPGHLRLRLLGTFCCQGRTKIACDAIRRPTAHHRLGILRFTASAVPPGHPRLRAVSPSVQRFDQPPIVVSY